MQMVIVNKVRKVSSDTFRDELCLVLLFQTSGNVEEVLFNLSAKSQPISLFFPIKNFMLCDDIKGSSTLFIKLFNGAHQRLQ